MATFVANHNVMSQLGNLLANNEVFLDAAHPFETLPDANAKYVPLGNGLCPFLEQPNELTWKIFSLAIHGDYSTQSMLYFVLKGSNALRHWAPKLIFENENKFQTVIGSHFMDQQSSSSALKIILNGYNACRPNFRTAYMLMCDSLCQNYVTLVNWQITNLKSSYILFHQVLNAMFDSEHSVNVTKTESQVLTNESKAYLDKRKRTKAAHEQLLNSFDPFMDEEERKARLATLEKELEHEQELTYRTMIVTKEEKVPKRYRTIFNFHPSDNVYISSHSKLGQVYTGFLVSSLLAPLVGPRVVFFSNLASVIAVLKSKPYWEWSFFDEKLCKLLANRKIQLSNMFDLCDTEWNDLLQGDSSSSIFARTHGPVNADQIHTHASLVSFLLRKGNVPELLWWPNSKKNEDEVNPIFELSIMTIQAGNIQLLQYLYNRGWFAMPKCEKSEALIIGFPHLLNHSDEVWKPNENEAILYQTLVQSVFKNRRYQTHTFNRTDLWSYQRHIRTMMNLLYSLVEPYYYLDEDTRPGDDQSFRICSQSYLGQNDSKSDPPETIEMPATIMPQVLSYMHEFTTMDIISTLVVNDQWDLIQWLGKMLTPFCQSKEAARVFFSRNAYMLCGQLWIADSVLKAIKNHPAKARSIVMLEWARTNIYDQFRNIGQETEHFYDMHFGNGSLKAKGLPKHLYNHEFPVWLNLAWFVKSAENYPFITTGRDVWNANAPLRTNMAIAMEDYLKNLATTTTLMGMPLYRYLVEELAIQNIIPTCTVDDDEVMGSSALEMTIQTNQSLLPRVADLTVDKRINGIAMAMVHDLLLVLQHDTKTPSVTQWALNYFDWRTLSLADSTLLSDPKATDLESLKLPGHLQMLMELPLIHQDFMRAGAGSPTASSQVKNYMDRLYQGRLATGLTGLAYLFVIEHFMNLQGVNKKLPSHLSTLRDTSRSPTLFQAFVRKLFPLNAQDYIRGMVPWLSDPNTRHKCQAIFNGYHVVAFNFWNNLTDMILTCWNAWTKIYLLGGYGIDEHNMVYLDPVRFSHLNENTSVEITQEVHRLGHLMVPQALTLFAAFAKLPENLFSFYAQRDATQRLALVHSIESEVVQEKVIDYMVILRNYVMHSFITRHRSDSWNVSLFDQILTSNRFDLIHWMHDFYFSPLFEEDRIDDYMAAIERHIESMASHARSDDLAGREQRNLFERVWMGTLDKNMRRVMKLGQFKVFDFLRNEYRTSYLQRNYKDVQFYKPNKQEFNHWSILRTSSPSQTLDSMLWKHLWDTELSNSRMSKFVHPDLPIYCGPIPLLLASASEKENIFRNYKRRTRAKRKRENSPSEMIESAKKRLKTTIQAAAKSKSSEEDEEDEEDGMEVDDDDESSQAPEQQQQQQPLAPAPPPRQDGDGWDDVWNDDANNFFY